MLPRSDQRWNTRKEVSDPATSHAPHGERKLTACFPWQWFICNFILDVFLYVEQLMKAEEKGSGAVAWSVYGAYVKAAGGPIVFLINAFLFLSTTGSIAFSNWWLSYWITQGSGVSLETTLLYCNRQRFLARISQKKYITTSLQWAVGARWELIWMCMIKKVTATVET